MKVYGFSLTLRAKDQNSLKKIVIPAKVEIEELVSI